MNSEAISAAALADAGRRRLATEQDGPRPAGVDPERSVRAAEPMRIAAVVRDESATRPTRP